MGDVYWGFMVIDVKNKEVYFDDGFGWLFLKLLYFYMIINELYFKFLDCDDFLLNVW